MLEFGNCGDSVTSKPAAHYGIAAQKAQEVDSCPSPFISRAPLAIAQPRKAIQRKVSLMTIVLQWKNSEFLLLLGLSLDQVQPLLNVLYTWCDGDAFGCSEISFCLVHLKACPHGKELKVKTPPPWDMAT